MKWRNLNPVYNETLTFDWNGKEKLTINVLDNDENKEDDPIGDLSNIDLNESSKSILTPSFNINKHKKIKSECNQEEATHGLQEIKNLEESHHTSMIVKKLL